MPFRMPAEWERHERTLMGWPCRAASWGETLELGRQEFATVANAIAAFEPVTMVCASSADAAQARAALDARVEIIELPMDGSWLRDNGPIIVTDGPQREARCFRFNAWGERHAERDRDARLGKSLATRLGVRAVEIDVVLEGGAIAVDGAGALIAPEGCLMHPNRNWHLSRDEVEAAIKEALGVDRMVWLAQGLSEDLERDEDRMYYGTDGHIDLFCAFIGPGRCVMFSADDDDPNATHLADAKRRIVAAGIEAVDFPHMGAFEADGRRIISPYLNFYVCNGAVLVPVSGRQPDFDQDAVAAIAALWPGREVVPIRLRAGPMQGGAIHCMTQQVPAVQ